MGTQFDFQMGFGIQNVDTEHNFHSEMQNEMG